MRARSQCRSRIPACVTERAPRSVTRTLRCRAVIWQRHGRSHGARKGLLDVHHSRSGGPATRRRLPAEEPGICSTSTLARRARWSALHSVRTVREGCSNVGTDRKRSVKSDPRALPPMVRWLVDEVCRPAGSTARISSARAISRHDPGLRARGAGNERKRQIVAEGSCLETTVPGRLSSAFSPCQPCRRGWQGQRFRPRRHARTSCAAYETKLRAAS